MSGIDRTGCSQSGVAPLVRRRELEEEDLLEHCLGEALLSATVMNAIDDRVTEKCPNS